MYVDHSGPEKKELTPKGFTIQSSLLSAPTPNWKCHCRSRYQQNRQYQVLYSLLLNWSSKLLINSIFGRKTQERGWNRDGKKLQGGTMQSEGETQHVKRCTRLMNKPNDWDSEDSNSIPGSATEWPWASPASSVPRFSYSPSLIKHCAIHQWKPLHMKLGIRTICDSPSSSRKQEVTQHVIKLCFNAKCNACVSIATLPNTLFNTVCKGCRTPWCCHSPQIRPGIKIWIKKSLDWNPMIKYFLCHLQLRFSCERTVKKMAWSPYTFHLEKH